jgi:hypothetical protein
MVKDGESRIANGEWWETAASERRAASAELRRVASSEWRVANGKKRRMANGGIRVGGVLNPPCRDMARLSETIPNPGLRSWTPTDALLGTHFRGRARIGENPRIANSEWREIVGAQGRCTLTVASHPSLLFPRFSLHTCRPHPGPCMFPSLSQRERAPGGGVRGVRGVRGHPRFAIVRSWTPIFRNGTRGGACRRPYPLRSVRSSIVIGVIGRSGGKLE